VADNSIQRMGAQQLKDTRLLYTCPFLIPPCPRINQDGWPKFTVPYDLPVAATLSPNGKESGAEVNCVRSG